MCQYEVGQVVSGTVTHSDDSKIKATLDDGTKAVAVGSLTMGSFVVYYILHYICLYIVPSC